MKSEERPAPRIYVADLAAYNEGTLRGEWIDITAETTVEDLREAVQAMLDRAMGEHVAEEYAIHDHEGFFGYEVHEYESLETVVRVGAFVAEHGEIGAKLLSRGQDVDEAERFLEEQYAGVGDSLSDWVFEHLNETGEIDQIPERWHGYLDLDGYANDLELGGDIFTIEVDGRVHVFWSR